MKQTVVPNTTRWLSTATALLLSSLLLTLGCEQSTSSSRISPTQFEQAGPLRVQVDLSRLTRAKQSGGEYLLTPGDVLQLEMPAATLSATTRSPDDIVERPCRVRDDGTIRLPVIGSMPAAGKTLDQVETDLAEAYYPRYVTRRPVIVAKVSRYHTLRVNVLGAVREPGTYELPARDCTLVGALLAAGGLKPHCNATVRLRDAQNPGPSRVVVLPVEGLDIPFADVELADGQTVEVQDRKQEVFTVTGLVKHPGTYPYPPDADYTLMQAIAMGGGVNEVADPKYATIYRRRADGQCVHARLSLTDLAAADAGQLQLKPGDVIALEHTTRTHMRMLLASMLRLGAGVNVSAGYNLAP